MHDYELEMFLTIKTYIEKYMRETKYISLNLAKSLINIYAWKKSH
jgi:hypothetical protein